MVNVRDTVNKCSLIYLISLLLTVNTYSTVNSILNHYVNIAMCVMWVDRWVYIITWKQKIPKLKYT